MPRVGFQSAKDFESGISMAPSLVIFWLFQASRGNDILIGVILCYTMLIFGLSLKKGQMARISYLSVIFLMICGLVVVAAQFSMPMSAHYISSSVGMLGLAVVLNELERKVLKNGKIWPTRIIWLLGLFYILTCFFSFFLNNDFLFKYFFVMEDQGISYYLTGWPRYYTVVALFFLLVPAKGYFKIVSFILTALPASVPSVIAWVTIHFKTSYLIWSLSILILGVISLYSFDQIFTPIRLFIEMKSLSIDGRADKISSIAMFGNPIGFDDNFSETFWIAISQTVGYLLAAIFSVLFFIYIYKTSKSWRFMFGAMVLVSLNPFPLVFVVLLAPLWNRSIRNVRVENFT